MKSILRSNFNILPFFLYKHGEMINTFNIDQLKFLLNNDTNTSKMKTLMISEELKRKILAVNFDFTKIFLFVFTDWCTNVWCLVAHFFHIYAESLRFA